jgi:hypothetical protein
MAIQILKGTSATISETFQVDGLAADLDSGVPVVTIVRPDGTAGPASGTVTHGAALSGSYSFVLAAQAQVTVLTVTWVGTIGGQAQTLTTTVEVVGAHLFTLAQLRAVKVGDNLPFTAAAFPNATVLDRRAEVTDDFEQRTGWSFIPRYAREVHSGQGCGTLILDHLKAQQLLSVTVNGVVQSVGNYTLDRSGILRTTSAYAASGSFTWGVGNVIVELVHGWDRSPAAVSSAALARAAMLLMPSVSSTVSSWTTPDGTSYSYDQAGQSFQGGGRRFYGVPAIDSVLSDPAYNAMGMAVA